MEVFGIQSYKHLLAMLAAMFMKYAEFSHLLHIRARNMSAENQVRLGSQRITVSQQARGHPLFPTLDFLVRSAHSVQRQLDGISKRVASLESRCSSLVDTQKELEKLVKEFGESTFDIENTVYQVSL